MTETVGVTYTLYFGLEADARRAQERLAEVGFTVASTEEGATPDAPHGLEARMASDSEASASAKLDSALAGVPHDPLIHWQVTRFSGFVTGEPGERRPDPGAIP